MARSQQDSCAVIVPAMQRPQNVPRFMRSLRRSGASVTAYWICDINDRDEVRAVLNNDGEVILNRTGLKTFARKCNIGYNRTEESWLLFTGDDVVFHDDWLSIALDNRQDKSFISTNDLGSKMVMLGKHATHPIIERSYIDEYGASWDGPGIVAHEGYNHWCVDSEWTAVAHEADEFVYVEDAKIEHMHPIWGKGKRDKVYRRGASKRKSDRKLYLERKRKHGSR